MLRSKVQKFSLQSQEYLTSHIKKSMNTYVSRGGLKLEHAISNFKLKISNLTILDVGSSTGGFVDCLLQNGAAKVYALDTSYGELAWKLRNDPRVVVMERTNILHFKSLPSPEGEGYSAIKVDLVTIDAGWTKLELVLPIVKNFLKSEGQIIALLKPHYEADKKDLVKGVLDKGKAERVKGEVSEKIKDLGFEIKDETESPVLGGAGNTEYLLLLNVIA